MSNYHQDPVAAPPYSGRTKVSHYQKFNSAAEQRAWCVLVIQPGCTSDRSVNEIWEETSLKMLKILVFWIFYSALQWCGQWPVHLYKSQHYKWAAVTLVLMFNPFLFHTGVFFYDFIKVQCRVIQRTGSVKKDPNAFFPSCYQLLQHIETVQIGVWYERVWW